MAGTVEQFRDVMLALLPQGAAWAHAEESHWAELLMAIADEFARIDARDERLLIEMNPRGALETLPEWEADYDLPGKCIHDPQSLADRRNALVTKYNLIGRQDRQFFIDVAADLGYEITITEYDADHPGGQAEYNGIPINGDSWNYVWRINAPATGVKRRLYGSRYPGPYLDYGIDLLECTLRALAHAHRVLFFSYPNQGASQ